MASLLNHFKIANKLYTFVQWADVSSNLNPTKKVNICKTIHVYGNCTKKSDMVVEKCSEGLILNIRTCRHELI